MGIEERLRRKALQQEQEEREAEEKAKLEAKLQLQPCDGCEEGKPCWKREALCEKAEAQEVQLQEGPIEHPSVKQVAEATADAILNEARIRGACVDEACAEAYRETLQTVLEQMYEKYDQNLEGYRRAQDRLIAERDDLLKTLHAVQEQMRRMGLIGRQGRKH